MGERPTIDLKQYRTPEVAQRVADAVGINLLQQSLQAVLIWTAAALIVNLACVWLLFSAETKALLAGEPTHWAIPWLVLPVAGISALATGSSVTAIRTVAIMQRNVMGLVAILFELTSVAYRDIKSVRKGDQQLPTATQVMQHVYEDVLAPLVREQTGMAGRFSTWLLQSSVGKAVRKSDDSSSETNENPDPGSSPHDPSMDTQSSKDPDVAPAMDDSTDPPPDSSSVPPTPPFKGPVEDPPPEVVKAEGLFRRNLRRVGWVMGLLHTTLTLIVCVLGVLASAIPLVVLRMALNFEN